VESESDAIAADGNERSFAALGYNESVAETFSTLQESQMELSHMADSKANIMITLSSILLSLVIAKIDQGSLVVPGTVFAVFCAPALIFAILCVMPSAAGRGKPGDDEKLSSDFNPLFFMHFSLLPRRRFEHEIERIMTDPATLYSSLTQDIYQAGVVLRKKKYRYLRWSYLCLLGGILAGLAALLAEVLLRWGRAQRHERSASGQPFSRPCRVRSPERPGDARRNPLSRYLSAPPR